MADEPITITRNGEGEPITAAWGSLRWICNDRIDARAEQTFGLVTILPGQQNPLHYHPNCEELLYVLEGQCDHRYGDRTVQLSTGDLIRVPSGVHHNARNTGSEPLRLVVSFSSGDRQTVMVEEPDRC